MDDDDSQKGPRLFAYRWWDPQLWDCKNIKDRPAVEIRVIYDPEEQDLGVIDYELERAFRAVVRAIRDAAGVEREER